MRTVKNEGRVNTDRSEFSHQYQVYQLEIRLEKYSMYNIGRST